MDYESKSMQRVREIIALKEGGWSYTDIGRLIGITGSRVAQIVNDGGRKLRAETLRDSAHVIAFRRQSYEKWKKDIEAGQKSKWSPNYISKERSTA